MALGKLRLAVFGDSWVSRFVDESTLDSSLPNGFLTRLLENTAMDGELVVAGFPGFTAKRMLELANMCRLRDMSRIYDSEAGCFWSKGDLKSEVVENAVPMIGMLRKTVDEDIDVVVIIAGYNDLAEGDSIEVYETLAQLRDLYFARGVCPILVTIGEGRPDVEEKRQTVNRWLLEKREAVDCDPLIQKLGNDAWQSWTHLKPEGSRSLGSLLADAMASRCSNFKEGPNSVDCDLLLQKQKIPDDVSHLEPEMSRSQSSLLAKAMLFRCSNLTKANVCMHSSEAFFNSARCLQFSRVVRKRKLGLLQPHLSRASKRRCMRQ